VIQYGHGLSAVETRKYSILYDSLGSASGRCFPIVQRAAAQLVERRIHGRTESKHKKKSGLFVEKET
jgi:hypothetical protein